MAVRWIRPAAPLLGLLSERPLRLQPSEPRAVNLQRRHAQLTGGIAAGTHSPCLFLPDLVRQRPALPHSQRFHLSNIPRHLICRVVKHRLLLHIQRQLDHPHQSLLCQYTRHAHGDVVTPVFALQNGHRR